MIQIVKKNPLKVGGEYVEFPKRCSTKEFFKTIALASTISLTLLGETGTAWGMWQAKLNVVGDEELLQVFRIHSTHKEESYAHNGYIVGNNIPDSAVPQQRAQVVSRISKCLTCSILSQLQDDLQTLNTQYIKTTGELEEQGSSLSVKVGLEALKLQQQNLALQKILKQQIILEETVKDTQKSMQVQKEEIQNLLLANQLFQNRVQKLEEENIRSLSAKENNNYTWNIIRKTLGYGGTAVGIGLLSWYGYNGI